MFYAIVDVWKGRTNGIYLLTNYVLTNKFLYGVDADLAGT